MRSSCARVEAGHGKSPPRGARESAQSCNVSFAACRTISPTSASARIASPLTATRAFAATPALDSAPSHCSRPDSLTHRILASWRSRSMPPPLDICKVYSTNEAASSKVRGQLKHPVCSSGSQASTPPLPPTRSARRMASALRHFYSASRPPALWLRCGGSHCRPHYSRASAGRAPRRRRHLRRCSLSRAIKESQAVLYESER